MLIRLRKDGMPCREMVDLIKKQYPAGCRVELHRMEDPWSPVPSGTKGTVLCVDVPFPVSWTVKMKKKQKETQDILSYHSQAAGCSDKARAKASGGRQPIEECGRTGL